MSSATPNDKLTDVARVRDKITNPFQLYSESKSSTSAKYGSALQQDIISNYDSNASRC